MYLVFGGSGFIGSYLLKYLKLKVNEESLILSNEKVIPENYDTIFRLIKNCEQVICCIGRTCSPNNTVNNIDYLEDHLVDNIRDNMYAPLILAQICQKLNKHIAILSTGCIYSGEHNENSVPNFFGSSYSIVKGYTDQILSKINNVLNLRIRLPITGDENPRCLISKLLKYERVTNIKNSATFIPSIFPVIIDLIINKVTGTYNMVNSGTISNYEILNLYKTYVNNDIEIKLDERIPNNRSNAILTSKLVLPDIRTELIKFMTVF